MQPMSQLFRTDQPEEVGTRQSLEGLLLQLPLIFAIAAVCTLISIAYIFIATPIYQSDALIQIEEKKGTTMGGLQQIASALDVTESSTAGEIDIIKSREVVGKAISELHLDIVATAMNRVPFFFEQALHKRPADPIREPMGIRSLSWGGQLINVMRFEVPPDYADSVFKVTIIGQNQWQLFGPRDEKLATGLVGETSSFPLGDGVGNLTIAKLNGISGNSFVLTKLSEFSAYKRVLANMKVAETARQSSVVKVTYEDPDAGLAASVVNAVARAYLEQNITRRSEEAEKSLDFLEKQLPETKKAVEDAEQAFNSYRLSRHSVNLDKEGETLLAQSVDLEKQRVEGELRKSDLDQRFQPNHPELIGLNSQLQAIRNESSKVSEEIAKLPETEQEALRLERDVKVNTDLYVSLLNNAQQLKVSRAGTIGNVNIIDTGLIENKPVRPIKALVVIFGGVIGLVLGIALSSVRRVLNPTLQDVDAIERVSGIPTYATIPASKEETRLSRTTASLTTRTSSRSVSLLEQRNPADPAIESLRGMRMGLQFAMVDAKNNLVVITGAVPAQGKTFVASNLAAILASGGKRILLVDGDMRKPRVNSYFGLPRAPGLSDVLSEKIAMLSAIRLNVLPNLDVLTAGHIPPNPVELLGRPALELALESVKGSYDMVIIDSAPVLPVADTLAIARIAGTIFMVLRADKSTDRQFFDGAARLNQVGATIKGIIFNGVQPRRFGYGYRYHYQYRYT
jgi:tyrosine-protein kinase Etk/Wzc